MPKRRHNNVSLSSVRKHKVAKVNLRQHAIHAANAVNFSLDSKDAVFSFTTPNIPIRFLNSPIEVAYSVRKKNPAFVNTDAHPEFLVPEEKDLVYLMPNAAYNFFARATIALNGDPIYDSSTLGGLYTQANRYLSTEPDRVKVVGSGLEVTKKMNSILKVGNNDNAGFPSSYERDIYSSVAGDSAGADKLVRVGLDGSGFLSASKNMAMSVLHNFDPEANKPCIIPPETRVNIRLTLNEGLNNFLISDHLTDTILLGITNAAQDLSDYVIEIKNVRLLYETLQLSDKTLFPKNEFKQYFDTHSTKIIDLDAGTNGVKTVSQGIPKAAKGVIIGFSPEEFHWLKTGANKPISNRFIFPDELKLYKARIGSQTLEFADGLEGLGGTNAESSSGAMMLHNYLTSKGLIDRPMSEMFPFSGEARGYAHLMYFDLTSPDIQELEHKSLESHMEFKARLKKKWNLFYIFVCEQEVAKLKNGVWQRAHLL